MGAVISFFRLVGKFIISIPQNIVCIFKLILAGGAHFIMSYLFPINYIIVGFFGFVFWWWVIYWKFLNFLFFAVIGGILFILDVGISGILNLQESVGNQFRSAAIVMTSCENDPRAWYRTPHYHSKNRFDRMLGIGICMAPCYSGYAPILAGLGCQRRLDSVPRRCPHAFVTLAAEHVEHNSGASGLDGVPDKPAEREELRNYRLQCDEPNISLEQAQLPEAVCWQTEAGGGTGSADFANTDVAGMCYEMLCSHGNRDARGQVRPSFCAALIPVAGKRTGSLSNLARIPMMAAVMLAAIFTARVRLQAKQALLDSMADDA
jgi:hypothetical protein